MNRIFRVRDVMLTRLFYRLLPVQVAIIAAGSINAIVDGIVAARFIDASTVVTIRCFACWRPPGRYCWAASRC